MWHATGSTVWVVDEWNKEFSFCCVCGTGTSCCKGAFCVWSDTCSVSGSDSVLDGGGLCVHGMVGEMFVDDLLPCGWVISTHGFQFCFEVAHSCVVGGEGLHGVCGSGWHVAWATEVAGDIVAAVSVATDQGGSYVSGEKCCCLFPTAYVVCGECADGGCVAEVIQGITDCGQCGGCPVDETVVECGDGERCGCCDVLPRDE